MADIAATVLPSVVSLQVRGSDGVATGSGFVLREDGYILTNNHVVAGAADGGDVVVLFSDGHESPAELVGRTVDYDLAVVKVDDSGLTPLALGDVTYDGAEDGVAVAKLGGDGAATARWSKALREATASESEAPRDPVVGVEDGEARRIGFATVVTHDATTGIALDALAPPAGRFGIAAGVFHP